jgi:hypothetical protein
MLVITSPIIQIKILLEIILLLVLTMLLLRCLHLLLIPQQLIDWIPIINIIEQGSILVDGWRTVCEFQLLGEVFFEL